MAFSLYTTFGFFLSCILIMAKELLCHRIINLSKEADCE